MHVYFVLSWLIQSRVTFFHLLLFLLSILSTSNKREWHEFPQGLERITDNWSNTPKNTFYNRSDRKITICCDGMLLSSLYQPLSPNSQNLSDIYKARSILSFVCPLEERKTKLIYIHTSTCNLYPRQLLEILRFRSVTKWQTILTYVRTNIFPYVDVSRRYISLLN